MRIITHIFGLPVIGLNRSIKFSIEKLNNYNCSYNYVEFISCYFKELRYNSAIQKHLDVYTFGDYFILDKVAYLSVCLSLLPLRFFFKTFELGLREINIMIRGYSSNIPLSMLKWFNTNYHYFVPEIIDLSACFNYSFDFVFADIGLNKDFSFSRFTLLGPLTLYYISRCSISFRLFIVKYKLFLSAVFRKFVPYYVQFEETILDINNNDIIIIINNLYNYIRGYGIRIFFSSFFKELKKISFINSLITDIFHIDCFFNKQNLVSSLLYGSFTLPNKSISLGIINGTNIWFNNINFSLSLIKNVSSFFIGSKVIYVGSNCSLMHLPYDSNKEDICVRLFLSFVIQKIFELQKIKILFGFGFFSFLNFVLLKKLLRTCYYNFKYSDYSNILLVRQYKRGKIRKSHLGIRNLPITTIGSFPQTYRIRRYRRLFHLGKISFCLYKSILDYYIFKNIEIQSKLGVDVLVNGEPEREDMVEFFCRCFSGCYITKNAWVHSYGTRCVKPPIIYGVVELKYNLISPFYFKCKFLKGIVTGPITLSKWSFLREDISISIFLLYISKIVGIIIRIFVSIGINIIQIDEPALCEFLPIGSKYLSKVSLLSFNYSCLPLIFRTIQIHSHICYSDVNRKEIVYFFKNSFIDVLSIESSKNIKENVNLILSSSLHKYFEIGLGVYDVHSKSITSISNIKEKIFYIVSNIDYNYVWINPDCGLKTRNYFEVICCLKNIFTASNLVRKTIPK